MRWNAKTAAIATAGACAAILGTNGTARAQEGEAAARPPEATMARVGPQLGARLGYVAGAGDIYSGFPIHDASSGALPVLIDLGWRFLPQLYAGAYGQVAPVFLKTNDVGCPAGFSCSALDWRVGIEADYHFLPRVRLDPYVGLGTGYEILHETQSGTMQGQSFTSDVIERGWEFAALSIGFDYRMADFFGFGPFVTGTLSKYDVETGQTTSAGMPSALPPVTHVGHELIVAGIRGTFNP